MRLPCSRVFLYPAQVERDESLTLPVIADHCHLSASLGGCPHYLAQLLLIHVITAAAHHCGCMSEHSAVLGLLCVIQLVLLLGLLPVNVALVRLHQPIVHDYFLDRLQEGQLVLLLEPLLLQPMNQVLKALAEVAQLLGRNIINILSLVDEVSKLVLRQQVDHALECLRGFQQLLG